MTSPRYTRKSRDEMTVGPLICHRCGAMLERGVGGFYVVRIDAVADPSPPAIDDDESATDAAADYKRLMESMREMSEQELMDQVHRRITLLLCTRCYQRWIEHPVG